MKIKIKETTYAPKYPTSLTPELVHICDLKEGQVLAVSRESAHNKECEVEVKDVKISLTE